MISMNMLNVFVQASPKMWVLAVSTLTIYPMLGPRQAPRIHNVKSFFTPVDSRKPSGCPS